MTNSIQDEFETIQLGDKRRNDGARSLLATLAANPQQSINAACNGWDESKAAYRLFDNPKVDPDAVLAAHAEQTRQRIRQESVVCVAQDTTELDYTSHPPRDAGVLNTDNRFGLYDHSHVAFTPEKLCLGVLDAELFDRTPESLGKSDQRQSQPIEVFFRVLKSGCKVEEIRLETTARLKRALMFYKVIAWRIMFLTFLGRECPELPCDVVFGEAEWKSVWQIVEREEPPEEAPTLEEFMPVLAQLGGYNRRNQDGPPGAEVIWRALRRMLDFALAWEVFGPTA